MPLTVFFSWQSDTPTTTGRNLIERALEEAASRISERMIVEEADRGEVQIDRDTRGEAGSPPIVDTILRKIERSAIFVPDLTFIGARQDGRPTPNPNVCIEYGWALKCLGLARIVPVMNISHGRPVGDAMPFNLRHLRNPIAYDCEPSATDEERRRARKGLARMLEGAIEAVLRSESFKSSVAFTSRAVFGARAPKDGQGRFREPNQPLGIKHDLHGRPPADGAIDNVRLRDGCALWLRLMPTHSPDRVWLVTELLKLGTDRAFILLPPTDAPDGYSVLRADDGFGVYSIGNVQGMTTSAVFAFREGEVWGIDVYSDGGSSQAPVPYVITQFRDALTNYTTFLEKLGVKPPYRWSAGIDGLRGRRICYPRRDDFGNLSREVSNSTGVAELVQFEGEHNPGENPLRSLAPFFDRLLDNFGVSPPRSSYDSRLDASI